MQNKCESGFYNPRVFLGFIALSFSSVRDPQGEAAHALTRL
jgi:hypothetical protein